MNYRKSVEIGRYQTAGAHLQTDEEQGKNFLLGAEESCRCLCVNLSNT